MASIQTSYNWAVETCAAPNVGYSQTYRNQRTVNGVTYYDCSSFIWYSLMEGGFDVVSANGGNTWPFTTYTMGNALTQLGFTKYDTSQPWKQGDILLRTDHTEMAFDNSRTMGAHTDGIDLDLQVSINSNPSAPSAWLELWRYEDGAVTEWIAKNEYLSTAEMQNNATIIFSYLMGKGWSKNAVAALCGNMQQESTMNPGLWESMVITDYSGFGLVQWTPSTNYTNWATSNGYDIDDGYGQLIWIDEETVNKGQWIATEAYPLSFEEFKTSTLDVGYLTTAFEKNFERPAASHPERIEMAEYWYKWYQGEYVPPPNPPAAPGYKHKMPIYFYLRKPL